MSKVTTNEILDRLLDRGIVQSNEESQVCCPDCVQDNHDGLYVFASVETYLKFAEAIGLTYNQPNCCVHLIASVETTLKYQEAAGGYPTNINCPTNFNECFDLIKNNQTAEETDRMLDKGIIEFGSISGMSQVCRIKEFIDFCLGNAGTNYTSGEILDRIIDKGIVISCNENDIIMASVETWLKYAEAVGYTPALSFTGDTLTQI